MNAFLVDNHYYFLSSMPLKKQDEVLIDRELTFADGKPIFGTIEQTVGLGKGYSLVRIHFDKCINDEPRTNVYTIHNQYLRKIT